MMLTKRDQELLYFIMTLNSTNLFAIDINNILVGLGLKHKEELNSVTSGTELLFFMNLHDTFNLEPDYKFEYDGFKYRIIHEESIDELFQKSVIERKSYKRLSSGILAKALKVNASEVEHLINNDKWDIIGKLCELNIEKICFELKIIYGYYDMFDCEFIAFNECNFLHHQELYYIFRERIL
jgi:hypothetical protein